MKPSEKTTYRMIPFACNSGKGKTIVAKSRAVATGDQGSGEGSTAQGPKETFLVIDMFYILIAVVVT